MRQMNDVEVEQAREMRTWMDAHFQALKTADANAMATLFSHEGTFEMVDPFDESPPGVNLEGRSEINAFFDELFQNEHWRVLECEVLSATSELGIGHCRATWVDISTKDQWGCDWIIVVTLDSDNLCTSLRDWSRNRPRNQKSQ